jgi:hypothetical protein
LAALRDISSELSREVHVEMAKARQRAKNENSTKINKNINKKAENVGSGFSPLLFI